MKQATILLSFTFLLPSVHLSVKNVHLLLPTSAERGQMMNWRLGETFNLLLNWILLMYFWKNNRAQEFWAFSAPAHEPNFDPAGMTAPAPSPVHNFLKVFYARRFGGPLKSIFGSTEISSFIKCKWTLPNLLKHAYTAAFLPFS